MSGHTPGPWKWDTDFNGLYNMDVPETVLDFEPWEGMRLEYHADQDRREANASLIAAAPCLLEALETITALYADEMYSERSCKEEDLPEVMAARKAIARAKGEA
jgi:hypothetical protein